jgi:hypothetical protein
MSEKARYGGGGVEPDDRKSSGGRAESTLLLELDASLRRFEQASAGLKGSENIVNAAALTSEVDRICLRLSVCTEPAERERLCTLAVNRLDRLQTILGVH